ncbi:MAG: hypothetical protein MZV64_43985 [Ignavibacteriales bacterium]|nr:hypothetical protein [Ignavibacteriales bacterium]
MTRPTERRRLAPGRVVEHGRRSTGGRSSRRGRKKPPAAAARSAVSGLRGGQRRGRHESERQGCRSVPITWERLSHRGPPGLSSRPLSDYNAARSGGAHEAQNRPRPRPPSSSP